MLPQLNFELNCQLELSLAINNIANTFLAFSKLLYEHFTALYVVKVLFLNYSGSVVVQLISPQSDNNATSSQLQVQLPTGT